MLSFPMNSQAIFPDPDIPKVRQNILFCNNHSIFCSPKIASCGPVEIGQVVHVIEHLNISEQDF
jgi:hypothetical protein